MTFIQGGLAPFHICVNSMDPSEPWTLYNFITWCQVSPCMRVCLYVYVCMSVRSPIVWCYDCRTTTSYNILDSKSIVTFHPYMMCVCVCVSPGLTFQSVMEVRLYKYIWYRLTVRCLTDECSFWFFVGDDVQVVSSVCQYSCRYVWFCESVCDVHDFMS